MKCRFTKCRLTQYFFTKFRFDKKTLFRKSSPLILTPDWNEQIMSFGYVNGYEIERGINFD